MVPSVDQTHRQLGHRVRFEWGPTGAAAVAEGADLAVVVDVLSFTTTVCVALERGVTVLPYVWKDERAAAYAEARSAVLATDRRRGLSPAAMATMDGVDRIVVPSPNGSTIAFGLADTGATVVAACLRNRGAVAGWLLDWGGTIAVVAAGERWPDGSLRPCTEDLWGAGSMLALLPEDDLSPEARLAADAFRSTAPTLAASMRACASGLELDAAGFGEDVAIASELDAAAVVPILDDGEFRLVN
jgi:2-phosphosulfolactate phosphatase